MLATPPYDRSSAREHLTADLQALDILRLNEANALTSERPNIPLGELTGGRITGLLSVVDQRIESVWAHAANPAAAAAATGRPAAVNTT